MKITREQILYIIIAGLVIALFTMVKCDGDTESSTKITTREKPFKIPEVKGDFKEPTNQSELPPTETDTVYLNGKPIYLQSPVNEKLKTEIATLKDSLSIIELLLEANRRREYSSQFSDKYVDINVKSTVWGTLENNEVYYTVKERDTFYKETTIEKTIVKTDKFGILAGGGIKQNIETKQLNYEVNAGIRLGKLSILGSANTRKEAGVSAIIEF